jgi:hypothetical protein
MVVRVRNGPKFVDNLFTIIPFTPDLLNTINQLIKLYDSLKEDVSNPILFCDSSHATLVNGDRVQVDGVGLIKMPHEFEMVDGDFSILLNERECRRVQTRFCVGRFRAVSWFFHVNGIHYSTPPINFVVDATKITAKPVMN